MREHYLGSDQVLQAAWSPEDDALKTVLNSAELSISLSHNDGDSVITVPNSAVVVAEVAPCAGMHTVCLYGEGTVSVSPDEEGDNWYVLSLVALEPKNICAVRIKIEGSGKLVMQAV